MEHDPDTLDPLAPTVSESATARRLAEIGPGGLRSRVARGSIVNAVFLVGVNALSVAQGVIVASVLGAAAYGLWGLLAISFGTLFALAAIGLDDKYIQQDHPDQQVAFEIAFTLQSLMCGLFTVIALVTIPLFSLLYDEPRILAPGLLLAIGLPLAALQTPMWVFYRRMDFARQRVLQSFQPVVAFVVTTVLAFSGAGFWSLVIGTLAGSATAAAVAVWQSPYKLRFRYERGAAREYASFSWPLLLGSVSAILMFQVPVTVAARSIGTAAVGAITLASQITQYTRRVDDVVTQALYPGICAMRDRADLLFESFSKSNRLALLWGFPAGVAAALFADDAVRYVLGSEWELAIPLIQVLGLSAAVDQIGFNWTAFARARGETRPLALASGVMLVVVIGVGVPLLLSDGLPGFAVGMGAGTLAVLVVRLVYLLRLFPALDIVSHTVRAIAPTVPATAAVLIERLVVGGGTSPARALAEVAGFSLLVIAGSWVAERALLKESVGYLRKRAAGTPAATSAPV